MKIKENYVLKSIVGTWSVFPIGDAVLNLNGILTLNDTGCMLWRMLEGGSTKEELTSRLVSEYDVSYDEAYADVCEFVDKLTEVGCLDN